jgi:hypothetical protein
MFNKGIVYTITSKDFDDYNDSTSGLLHDIWWEVIQQLSPELFKEALVKGFVLNEVDTDPKTGAVHMALVAPAASKELHEAIVKFRPDIIYMPTPRAGIPTGGS